jgi:hypothetical protein
MLISHPKKFIFVHIYKNAGTSVISALYPYAFYNRIHAVLYRASQKLRMPFPARLNPQPLPGHSTAYEIVQYLGAKKFDEYFSFAIVRNPWDWQTSLYSYMYKKSKHSQHKLIHGFKDFEEYLRWRCAESIHFQRDFLYSSDGSRLVDFVIRYEQLTEDFKQVCERIGVQASLPLKNVSKTKPYQEFYNPETIELVRRTFAPDIETFGYDFE